MYGPTASVLAALETLQAPSLIDWACPVPFFGTLLTSRIATVGINPSNREFVDTDGNELPDHARRLPTLRSLGLTKWNEASSSEIRQIFEACTEYFDGNPYDRWFRRLDAVIARTGASFYTATACHVDLVPYATRDKWGLLGSVERQALLASSRSAFGHFLRDSAVELLVLNGRSVVNAFEALAEMPLATTRVSAWGLPRADGVVAGIQSTGTIHYVGGVDLERRVTVVGYNHNIQSSYGVTSNVISAVAASVERVWETVVA